MLKMIESEINLHLESIKKLQSIKKEIEVAAKMVVDCIKNGGKILLCGNGGSAADAQHIATEFTGRYKIERKGLAAIALTTDTSALTAIGNDYGFDKIFSRQIEALANKNDLLIAISTSGNSKNVINAIEKAKDIGCAILGLSGKNGGSMNEICDLNLIVPSDDTPRIQEMHILIGHIICQAIDDEFSVLS